MNDDSLFRKAAVCPSLAYIDNERFRLSKFMYHTRIGELAAAGSEEAKLILAFRTRYGDVLEGRVIAENRNGSVMEIARGVEGRR